MDEEIGEEMRSDRFELMRSEEKNANDSQGRNTPLIAKGCRGTSLK